MELKIVGRNIPRRSYHSAAVYDGRMYVYGGYDVNTGNYYDWLKINKNDHFYVLIISKLFKKNLIYFCRNIRWFLVYGHLRPRKI